MIKSYVNELNQINAEIKHVSSHLRILRKKSKEMEEYIIAYLRQKDQPGVKYNGTAIIVESKPKRATKKKVEMEQDTLRVLEYHGIEDPKAVLEEIMEARRGHETEQDKIKIKKLKGPK